jgi:serine/threonine protein kinase
MVVKRFKLGQVHVLLLLRKIQKMMAMGLSAGQEVGVSIEGTAASMVMEWMVGDLGNFMDLSLMPSKWDSALNNLYDMYVMLSIARQMKKLHTSGLLHQDLKALNILLGRVSVKITHKDIVWLPMLSQHLLNISLKIGDYERSEGVIGLRLWRAPEVLQALKDGMKPLFTCKTDIYSFAMVCSEILTGCTPFQGHHLSDYDLVLSGKRPSFLII